MSSSFTKPPEMFPKTVMVAQSFPIKNNINIEHSFPCIIIYIYPTCHPTLSPHPPKNFMNVYVKRLTDKACTLSRLTTLPAFIDF